MGSRVCIGVRLFFQQTKMMNNTTLIATTTGSEIQSLIVSEIVIQRFKIVIKIFMAARRRCSPDSGGDEHEVHRDRTNFEKKMSCDQM